MQIGQFVKNHIGKILRHCEHNPGELSCLMDATYSRNIFNLNWPFCVEAGRISSTEHERYWIDHYVCRDKRLRVCSQWYSRHLEVFSRYLLSKGIIDKQKLCTLIGVGEPTPIPPRPTTPDRGRGAENRRHGSIQIGDAQNALIRVVLSRLGRESFDEADWQRTTEYFLKSCAYCGGNAGPLEMDHGVPINKTKLGEHRLGNVIPSCKKCNKEKHRRDYIEYLGADVERITKIENYMETRNYIPLGGNALVRSILEQAHKEVSALAERYVAIIDTILADKPPPG
jgi:5-methylcytosine-specific restriction endonuclease McrA